MGQVYDIDEQWLREKYQEEELTDAQIAGMVGCSRAVIQKRRAKYGIATIQRERTLSEEHKHKIGQALRGCKMSAEARQHMSEAAKNRSPEHLRKISEALQGRVFTEEHRHKISMGAQNRSEEHTEKLAIAHRGVPLATEHKQKISEALKGRVPWHKGKKLGPLSTEHRQKISEALTGRISPMKGQVLTEEHKQKIGKGNREYNISQNWLYKKYIEEALNDGEIAQLVGCSSATVGRKRREHDIAGRNSSEAHMGQAPWNKGKVGVFSQETRRRMSESHREIVRLAWANGVYDNRTPKSPFVVYVGIKMRSEWESRLATVFDAMGWAWEYEPRYFQYDMEDGSHTYTPDFYVPHLDCYFEPHAKYWGYNDAKFDAVREQHNIALIVLNEEILKMYERTAQQCA